ncbi:MAG TPA: hypothetical protein VFE94_01435 [Candidatus Paceibacterota bacterium]|nr:hypothetical protein [Candidatus Paceibacterota bacterium]
MLRKTVGKYAIIGLAGVLLVWFLYAANFVPFLMNKNLNAAIFQAQQGDCQAAFQTLENIPSDTYLDSYVANQYVDVTTLCINRLAGQERNEAASQALAGLQERSQQHPHDTKTWIALGAYTTLLLSLVEDPREKTELAEAAKSYLAKAKELSPKREEVDERLVYLLILTKDYQGAKEVAQNCAERFPLNSECVAWRLVTELWLGERDSLHLGSLEPPYNEDIARHFYTTNFLNQLLQFYLEQENYGQLVEVYLRLKTIDERPEYYASLALAYDKLGSWEDMAIYSFKVYQLRPAAKEEVRAFLKEALAKGKTTDPVRLNELRKSSQLFRDIEQAFPGIFESL